MTADDLVRARCSPQGTAMLPADVASHLALLPGWGLDGNSIVRRYAFADFHRTMAFVNAVAWIAHAEDHHPELVVGYAACTVRFR